MKNILAKERLEWVDIARGLAIGLVVLAHTPIPGKLSSYIYSFHVPLFFIISGFLLASGLRKKPGDYVKNKVVRLAIPYFFFSLVAYLYWLLARSVGWDASALGIDPATPLNGTFLAIRDGAFMTHNGALWFICSLFVSELAFYGIFRLVKGDKMLLIISLVAAAVVGILYNTFVAAPLPWSIDTVPLVVVFLGFGYFLKEYYSKWAAFKKAKYAKPATFLGLLLVSVACWHFNPTPAGTVDMFYGLYGNFLLYFAAAFAGSLAVILLFESFIPHVKVLSYMGKNSLIIYALHQKVIFGLLGVVLSALVGRAWPFVVHGSLEKLGNGVTYLLVTLVVLVPVIWLLNTYCPAVIGKGWKPAKKGAATADIR